MSLFDITPPGGDEDSPKNAKRPLAERMRPQRLEDYIGQEHILGPGKPLRRQIERDALTSIILWGPPGVGKTTLARLIARTTKCEFIPFSAVMSGIKEIKAVMADAERLRNLGRRTILFVDEIHRFNKAQQDAFLPYVEKGDIVLIGATTENPSFEVISALLSRSRVYALRGLTVPEMMTLLRRALPEVGLSATDELLEQIAIYANGDGRQAYNTLEAAAAAAPAGGALTEQAVQDAMQRKVLLYDKGGEEHYNLVSALHKSVRSSDADAALYWLGRMLEAGEDRMYIARRLVRIASEDVGLADPRALEQTIAVMQAVHFLGIPEGDLALAQAAIYLSVAPKSDAAYKASGRGAAGCGAHGGRAGSDAPAQRAHCADEGVGICARLSARAQVRRRDGRHGVPAALVERPAILRAYGAGRGEADQREAGGAARAGRKKNRREIRGRVEPVARGLRL